jgi:hypothetical protein
MNWIGNIRTIKLVSIDLRGETLKIMKKLLFILLLILFSCEKDEPLFCWQCKSIVIDYGYKTPVIDSWYVTWNDKTESFIRDYEVKNTYPVDTVKVVTICQLKY